MNYHGVESQPAKRNRHHCTRRAGACHGDTRPTPTRAPVGRRGHDRARIRVPKRDRRERRSRIGTREDTDVLVVGDSIADVGRSLNVPEGTVEIDSRGGIVMPGMIDTHRHMWQSVMRGFGADWTLTNYFYFYYLEWGHAFRPEEVYAGNLLAGLDSSTLA